MLQTVKMKGKRVRREGKPFRHGTGRKAIRSGLHKEAKHVEAVFLRESGQSRDNFWLFHNSTTIEIIANVKA
ncbi:MAG: hypothetical protein ACXW3V_08170 [Methylocystis sp.]